MKAEEDLFLAIGNIDEELVKDVLENDLRAERTTENTGLQHRGWSVRTVGAILVMIVLAIGFFAVKGVIKRKPDFPTPTPSENESGKSDSTKTAYERFPVLLIEGTLYEASAEECEQIEAEIGVFPAKSETDSRNVTVYKIVGVDKDNSVAVYFPEEQKYYVYFNKSRLP